VLDNLRNKRLPHPGNNVLTWWELHSWVVLDGGPFPYGPFYDPSLSLVPAVPQNTTPHPLPSFHFQDATAPGNPPVASTPFQSAGLNRTLSTSTAAFSNNSGDSGFVSSAGSSGRRSFPNGICTHGTECNCPEPYSPLQHRSARNQFYALDAGPSSQGHVLPVPNSISPMTLPQRADILRRTFDENRRLLTNQALHDTGQLANEALDRIEFAMEEFIRAALGPQL